MELNNMVVIGIAVMLLMALGVVFFVILYQRRVITHQIELNTIRDQKQLELVQASIEAEEEERMRIALELHDDVCATLSSARLFLFRNEDMPYSEENVMQAKNLLDNGINSIRAISHKLQPAALQHIGLQESLKVTTETIGQSGMIKTEFVTLAVLPRLIETKELAVYRIAQELIANVVKHSHATYLRVITFANITQIELEFEHDGVGLTQEKYEQMIYKKGAIGLKNIVNRQKSVNASLTFYRSDKNLYHTVLLVPIH